MAATSRTIAMTILLLVIFLSECFRKWAWKPILSVLALVCCGGELLKRCFFWIPFAGVGSLRFLETLGLDVYLSQYPRAQTCLHQPWSKTSRYRFGSARTSLISVKRSPGARTSGAPPGIYFWPKALKPGFGRRYGEGRSLSYQTT